MRYSRAFIPTRKDDPADAELPSHRLLVRAGYIEQVATGIYDLLPLGRRAVRKIEAIVREELERVGGQELLMPMVQPAELWQRSGRWAKYGAELLRFVDRRSQGYCLGPTHEEVVTELVRRHVRSYRDLPLNLFQIQARFRDELRPRGGLLRGREFLVQDAYTFDASDEAARETYRVMLEAYCRIFERCGLRFRAVAADGGALGGSSSHELQALAPTGEDRLLSCASCGAAANQEVAAMRRGPASAAPDTPVPTAALIETPGSHTIEQVCALLGLPAERLIKTLIVVADGELLAALVRGDHALNEVKLARALGAGEVRLADDAEVEAATGAAVGFAGPVGLSLPIVADLAVAALHDVAVGANRTDAHLVHVEPGRDFEVTRGFFDLVAVGAGDPCAHCGAPLEELRGIEVGHLLLPGTRFTEPLGATFLAVDGATRALVMGSYSIGLTRVLAAAVEQNHDAHGMILPTAIAPYEVIVLPLQMDRPEVVQAADAIEHALTAAGLDVLLDDRDLRAGAKFKDADLIGIPYRVAVGARSLAEGRVELKHRRDSAPELVPLEQLALRIAERERS